MKTKKLYMTLFMACLLTGPFRILSQTSGNYTEINLEDPATIPEFLQVIITVNFGETPLGDALLQIADLGNFQINFNRSRMYPDKKITGFRKEEKTADVLRFVLKDTDVVLLNGGDKSLIIKSAANQKKGYGIIKGKVVDSETGQPLIGTNIILAGKGLGGSTDKNGNYVITNIPTGKYTIEFSYIGYQEKRLENIEVSPESLLWLDVELIPAPLQLEEIVITPGRFVVMGRDPIVMQTLTEQNLQTVPFGEDVYRAITRLPGVSAGDYSAKYMIRGGKNEEILTLMDGIELYEPFHLKDVDGGILSIIDVKSIEGIDLFTGGFPAEYGEYMSGVLKMRSANPGQELSQTSLGISFMNAKFMSQGTFHKKKGSWLISARRGYLDLVLDLMDEDDPPLPKYYDTFAKFTYQLGNGHTLGITALHSQDKLYFVEKESDDVFDTRYGNSYGGLNLNSALSPRLFLQNIVSFGRITHHRRGTGYFDNSGVPQYSVDDRNRVNVAIVKQDWDFELFQQWFLKWGFYYNYQNATYNYRNSITHLNTVGDRQNISTTDTSLVYLDPAGDRFGGYFSSRFQLFPPLNIELGLRYDHNGYTNDQYLSPRVNFVYDFGKQTYLRGGWGHFNQSQRMHEIKAAYGEKDFFPAQKSQHWVFGLEHTHHNGLNLRLETYYKVISYLRPDHRIFSNDIEVFPEVQEDDLFSLTFKGAQSKGVEFYLKYDEGKKFSCWASYALAYANETVENFIFQGEISTLEDPVVLNPYDQRHTFYLDFNYRPNRNWHLNVSWQYHTGWPYTQRVIRTDQLPDGSTSNFVEYDQPYSSRLPSYHRLDIQMNRHIYFSKSQLTLFLALINVYNHENVRNIKYSTRLDADGNPYLVEQKGYWFPLLPSLGVTWTLQY